MHRRWILIGQSFLKTVRTIEDKNIPSRGGEEQTRHCGKSEAAQSALNDNGLEGGEAKSNYYGWVNG